MTRRLDYRNSVLKAYPEVYTPAHRGWPNHRRRRWPSADRRAFGVWSRGIAEPDLQGEI